METFSNGAIFFVFVLAIILSFPTTIVLLLLYRRAVNKYMKTRMSAGQNEPSPFAAPITQPNPSKPDITIFDRDTSVPTGTAEIFDAMQFARRRAMAIHAFAGICYAFVMAQVYIGERFHLWRLIGLVPILAFPVVLTINIVGMTNRHEKSVVAATYLFILIASIIVVYAVSPELRLREMLSLVLILTLPLSIILQTFLMRKIRAIGPLVLIFMILIVFGSQMVVSVSSGFDDFFRALTKIGLNAYTILSGLFFAGIILLSPIAWLALLLIGSLFKGKKITDQSLILDSIWLTSSFTNALLLSKDGFVRVLLAFLPFVVYKLVLWICFLFVPTNRDGKKLLVLRVFSLGKKSSRLFESLGKYWRYGGSVRLIAGPDLADNIIKPHEFVAFVSRKLSRLFIDDLNTFNERFSEMDDEAGRDARFQVNDFFCRADTWKAVLSRLVDESDVVLMDLRGFSGQTGCAYEINELINTVPLQRVIFIIENEKDKNYLLQAAHASWQRIKPSSPNRASQSTQLCLFKFADSGSAELRQLLRTMCLAAQKSAGHV